MTEGSLVASLVFGSVGFGYMLYGRRQRNVVAFVAGLGLIALPYAVHAAWALAVTGLVLLAAPILLRHWF